MKQPQSYVSYLLRIWRSGKGAQATWRASLECPMTGERRGFRSLHDLFVFLEEIAQPESEQKHIAEN